MALEFLPIVSETRLREVRVIEGGGTSYLGPTKNLMGYGNHIENFLCIQPKCSAALSKYFDVWFFSWVVKIIGFPWSTKRNISFTFFQQKKTPFHSTMKRRWSND